MDENCVSHLKCGEFDVFVIYDYRNIEFDFSEINFEKYNKKYFIAWSMGGYVANLFANILNDFDKKIAINSTNQIIHNNFGIPEKIYNVTIKLFCEESKNKFISNIFQNIEKTFEIKRSISELKEELISIKNIKIENEINYDKVFISKKDIIVPTLNQLNFWENKTEIAFLDAPHYPFYLFENWGDILC